jgi:hypothetical protein
VPLFFLSICVIFFIFLLLCFLAVERGGLRPRDTRSYPGARIDGTIGRHRALIMHHCARDSETLVIIAANISSGRPKTSPGSWSIGIADLRPDMCYNWRTDYRVTCWTCPRPCISRAEDCKFSKKPHLQSIIMRDECLPKSSWVCAYHFGVCFWRKRN